MQAKIDCQKLYVSKLYLSKLYFPNCFLAVPRQTDRLLLKNTTKEHSCDPWDMSSERWGDMTWPTKRQWQRQRLGMCQCSCKQLLQHKFCLQRQFGENIFGWKQSRGWRKQCTGEKQLGTGAAHNYEFLWWLKIWWHWMQAKPNIYLIIGLHT